MVPCLYREQGADSSAPDLSINSSGCSGGFHLSGQITILTAVDTQTGVCMAVQMPSKKVTEYAAAELRAFLQDCGRSSECIVQTDQEPAIMALVKKACSELQNIKLRKAPTYS